MASAAPKEYGLLMRKKPERSVGGGGPVAQFNRLAAFGDSSDSDDPSSKSKVNVALGDAKQRQIRRAQATALDSDPTIFQYDELYDDMQQKRDADKAARNSARSADKGPKYIKRLLVTAESRKKEYERRIERQVQKEREAEGEQFKDKESFVTSSYRAKLEEIKAAEEAEKRSEYLESVGDVTKQRDLGGFYRHLYEQKMGGAAAAVEVTPIDVAVVAPPPLPRTYRKRKASASDQDDTCEVDEHADGEPKKRLHIQSNLDADSDFSIDSDSESDDDVTKNVGEVAATVPISAKVNDDSTVFVKPAEPIQQTAKEEPSSATLDEEIQVAAAAAAVEPKIKVDIWKKRTVGDLLDLAIQRYYERKVARESG